MSSPSSVLVQNEREIYRARVSHYPAVVSFLFVLLGFVIVPFNPYIGAAVLVITGAIFIRDVIVILTTEIVITNQRLRAKTGLLSHRSIEILLAKLESIEVEQNLSERLCNYGTIVVRGTGATQVPFKYIREPKEVRRQCVEATEQAQRGVAQNPASASVPAPSATPLATSPQPVFDVQVLDVKTGLDHWIEVRAATLDEARAKAVATGASVGNVRLKGIT